MVSTGAGISLILMGFFSSMLGVLELRRKPVVLASRVMTVVAVLCILPALVAGTTFIMSDSAEVVSQYRFFDWLLTAMALLAFTVPVVFIMVRSYGDYVLYNVTQEIVLESLRQVLARHGLEYSESRVRGLVTTFYRISKFSFDLVGRSGSVEVTVNPRGMSVLRFKSKRSIPGFDQLVTELRETLESRVLQGAPIGGVFRLLFSVPLIGLGVFMCVW